MLISGPVLSVARLIRFSIIVSISFKVPISVASWWIVVKLLSLMNNFSFTSVAMFSSLFVGFSFAALSPLSLVATVFVSRLVFVVVLPILSGKSVLSWWYRHRRGRWGKGVAFFRVRVATWEEFDWAYDWLRTGTASPPLGLWWPASTAVRLWSSLLWRRRSWMYCTLVLCGREGKWSFCPSLVAIPDWRRGRELWAG